MYTEFSSLGKFYFHPRALQTWTEAGPFAFRQLCQAPRVQASVYWHHVFDNSSDVLAPWATARLVRPLIRPCFQLCNFLHALITSSLFVPDIDVPYHM